MRCLYLMVLIAGGASAAQVYKWTDEHGRVHYGDQPQTTQARQFDVKETTVNSGVDSRRRQTREKLLQVMEEDRQQKQHQQQQRKAQQHNKKQRCHYYRDRLKRLQRAGRVYRLDDKGNRVYVSDKQRQQSLKQLRRQIAASCH